MSLCLFIFQTCSFKLSLLSERGYGVRFGLLMEEEGIFVIHVFDRC